MTTFPISPEYRQSLIAAATDYMARGLLVTIADGKNPGAVMGHDWHNQPRSIEQVTQWINTSPHPTIGFQAGPPLNGDTKSVGVIMVDIDTEEELVAAKELFDGTFPECWWGETGRGHRLVFRYDEASVVPGRGKMMYKAKSGAEVMIQFGAGGKAAFAVVPPSNHFMSDGKGSWTATGRKYKWRFGCSPGDLELPTFPVGAAKKLQTQAQADAERKKSMEARLEGVERKEGDPESGVHHAALQYMLEKTKNMMDAQDGSKRLMVCACRGAEYYLSDACFIATIGAYEEEAGTFAKQYEHGELIDRLRQAERRPDVVVGGRLVELAFGDFAPYAKLGITDTANAQRLHLLSEGNFKYVPESDCWYAWSKSEGRWCIDREDLAIAACASKGLDKLVLHELKERTISGEIDGFDGWDKFEKAYRSFARQSANLSRIKAAVALARGEASMQLQIDDLDADPYLVGTPKGIVDLRSGKLTEARRSAFITKSTTAPVGDAGSASRWLSFIDETFGGDQEMIAFMQRLLGQSLIGEQREHVMPVFFGRGANGKSVLIDTVSTVLGDYASPMPDGLLTATRSDRHPTEIADLLGVRLCFSEETSQTAELDEPKVKRLTGGSKLKGRYMRKDFFEFMPSHTPFLITNHRPKIVGTDEGIWRRVLVANFDHTVPKEQRDPDLKGKLLKEADGILAWMIEGCQTYLREGLNPPKKVKLSTEIYRRDSDPFLQFLDECIREEGGEFLLFSEIEKRYGEWSLAEGRYVTNLASQLKTKFKYRYGSNGTARGYKGLRLVEEGELSLVV
ncbi:phage/plasmid primase, P4 family [Aeoliella sp.]|uniref:phage/plasmid primase, P4 family n=1 Tax=Aeoliella sp. TaxID=2795800 RepID=UPI003CCC263F